MSDHDPSQLPVGTILEGKFRVSREIGRGGMAAVYEAENVDIGKRVAVKILSADLITSRVVRERFLREARAASAIHSPYICDVYDSGTYQERPFLVMELLQGESLYELQARERRLDFDITLRIALQAARGLAKAHAARVVHRDLKPENIFLTHNEDGELVTKILDFGLAKFYETSNDSPAQARLTREGALFGTPAYMAPEQAQGQGNVDHRCDLWALGCIVYECLTARTVWRVDQGVAMILAQIATSPLPVPSQIRSDLPGSFDRWFVKALERDPSARFQSAKEFALTLSRALPANRLPTGDDSSAEESPRAEPWFGSIAESGSPGATGTGAPSSAAFPVTPRAPVPPPPTARRGQGPRSRRARLAVGSTLLAAGVGLAGYLGWRYVAPRLPAQANATDATLPTRSVEHPPLEKAPWALQVGSAQVWLAKGEAQRATTMFREAFQGGGTGLTRNLISHAEAVLENKGCPCVVTGLGRPRPFTIETPSSRPTVSFTKAGAVVVWADTHQDVRKRQAYSVLLDAEMRRVSEPHLVTPESHGVLHPQLFPVGKRLGLVYANSDSERAGVYVRLLQADGRIAGPAIKLSTDRGGQNSPAVVQTAEGTYWAFWEGRNMAKRDNLIARRLNSDLEPVSAPLSFTGFAAESGTVSRPHAALFRDSRLIAAFSLRQNQTGRIVALDIPYQGRGPATGVVDPSDGNAKDVHLGKLIPISTEVGQFDQARVACNSDGCFVAWDNERGGATVAFMNVAEGRVTWRHELGKKGSRPALASAGGQVALSWYDNSRVHLAQVSHDGVAPSTILGKVSGFQPYPSVAPGATEGEWYVSWRDYESGHLEAFVARARCDDAGKGT